MSKYGNWVYWFLTDISLGLGLMLWPEMMYVSIGIVVIHSLHYYWHLPHIFSFPMQVRVVYLCLLVLGRLPYCSWINWLQLVGTTALITVDYCPLARTLSLMPWNRSKALSWNFVRKAIFSMPVSGSIIQHVSPDMVAKLHPNYKTI